MPTLNRPDTNAIYYLTAPPEVRDLGAWCVTVGRARTDAGESYPPDGLRHPRSYRNVSGTGRTLDELQIVFVADGAGWYEDRHGETRRVEAGNCLLLLPGVWHRYRPDPDTGWTEYWVGIRGEVPLRTLEILGLSGDGGVVPSAHAGTVSSTFRQLVGLAAIHDLASHVAMVAETLRLITSLAQGAAEERDRHASGDGVGRAIELMHRRVGFRLNLVDLAGECGLSEATLRRAFRARTGSSPYRYFMALKVNAVKRELAHSDQPLKAIADQLGFTDQYHLSRVFREYVGVPPSVWRRDGG